MTNQMDGISKASRKRDVHLISPTKVRRIILDQSKRANVGHIGSCLCIVEILSALYGHVLRNTPGKAADRDRFVLSKGHAALALYAVLSLTGDLATRSLDSFCGDDSCLGVHPESSVSGVDFSTGSLGHGLSIAAGAALGARIQASDRRVFCLMSDAECNEGSVWEAAMFSSHHRLHNLHAIIDWNGQQAFGLTREVMNDEAMRSRWESFGWRVSEVDGHSVPAVVQALSENSVSDKPHIVLAKTVFGRGVSYMEKGQSISRGQISANPVNWHYLPMTDEEYRIAIEELPT